jgi:teichuronic acid exporter
LTESLKQKAIAGTKWKTSLNIGRYLISFLLSIILARLLEPREFGLIGMVGFLVREQTKNHDKRKV